MTRAKPKEKLPKPRWGSMPICERCWVDPPEKYQVLFENGAPGLIPYQDPEDPESTLSSYLVVREPVRFKGPEADNVKQCGFCGNPTWVGIFIRQDLNTIDFPPEVDN